MSETKFMICPFQDKPCIRNCSLSVSKVADSTNTNPEFRCAIWLMGAYLREILDELEKMKKF